MFAISPVYTNNQDFPSFFRPQAVKKCRLEDIRYNSPLCGTELMMLVAAKEKKKKQTKPEKEKERPSEEIEEFGFYSA